jgi:hypothetical protein
MQAEMAFSQHKPAKGLVHSEGWQLEAVEARGPGNFKVDEVLVLHHNAKNAGSLM